MLNVWKRPPHCLVCEDSVKRLAFSFRRRLANLGRQRFSKSLSKRSGASMPALFRHVGMKGHFDKIEISLPYELHLQHPAALRLRNHWPVYCQKRSIHQIRHGEANIAICCDFWWLKQQDAGGPPTLQTSKLNRFNGVRTLANTCRWFTPLQEVTGLCKKRYSRAALGHAASMEKLLCSKRLVWYENIDLICF